LNANGSEVNPKWIISSRLLIAEQACEIPASLRQSNKFSNKE